VKALILFVLPLILFAEDISFFYPIPSIVEHEQYTVCYDPAHKNPLWVCWQTNTNPPVCSRKGLGFKPDPSIAASPSTKAYAYSGYDRGHMCPANIMRHSLSALKQTFYTSNIAPQLPGLNRGDWRSLEAKLYKESRSNILVVVAGPLYLPSHTNYINDICVPEGFWKVVYTSNSRRAWYFTNDTNKQDISVRVIDINTLSEHTGLRFK